MIANRKVVIIGGGFGGLEAALGLKRAPVEVTLIDKTNHHLFQPLLYQVASAALSPGDIATPIRHIVRHQKNTVVMMADVTRIDKERKHVHLANGSAIYYDYLIVAVGASHSYFGHPEWEKFAPGLKTLPDALTIRERLLISYEKAERSDNLLEAEQYLDFVVIGGGPTGVEMAGAIAEVAHQTMIRDFRRINVHKTRIFLIEAMSQLLAVYPLGLAERARRDLERMGVEVLLNHMVTNINEEGVHLGSRIIHTKNIIWAAGNQASPLLKTLDVALDRQGRVIVESDCSVPSHEEIFIIGDAAHLEIDGKILPGIAPTAIQQGRYVEDLIAKSIPKEKRTPFRYFDKGMMATIGKNKAVAMSGRLRISGFIAWLAWGFIHIAYLVHHRNKLVVMISWLFQYCTGTRGARLINHPLDDESPEGVEK